MQKRRLIVKVRRVPKLKATFLGVPLSIAKKVAADFMEIGLAEDGRLIYTPIEVENVLEKELADV